MKMIYISSGKIPAEAANSVHVMKMAQAFADQGNDVTLAYTACGPDHKPDDALFARYAVRPVFRLFPVISPLPFMQRVYFAARSAIESLCGGYDLVFSRCIPSAYCSLLLRRAVMFEIHDSPKSLNPVPRWMFERIIASKWLQGLVVISSALKDHLVALYDYEPEKILTLHDGADPFHADNIAALKMSDLSYHAGYTGHLYQGRGVDVILSLAAACPDIAFHIVGGRPEDIAYWKERYDATNVHFYGHVPHKDVANYIGAFDVLLAPYQKKVSVHGNTGNTASWMSPLKVFEYMASGKPIICSDIPVLREVLEDGRNCVLCDPEDNEAWRKALITLQSDKEKAGRIGLAAKADFEKKYTWYARAGEILKYTKKPG